MEKGFIKGYPDGTFKPDNHITRAEFITLVNNAFNCRGKTQISFKDVAEGTWYYDAISAAIAEGYINGYEDGTMRPNNPITRAEVGAIVSKIKGTLFNEESKMAFKDDNEIPDWAKKAIKTAANAGIMNGYPDGSFRAKSYITRATISLP